MSREAADTAQCYRSSAAEIANTRLDRARSHERVHEDAPRGHPGHEQPPAHALHDHRVPAHVSEVRRSIARFSRALDRQRIDGSLFELATTTSQHARTNAQLRVQARTGQSQGMQSASLQSQGMQSQGMQSQGMQSQAEATSPASGSRATAPSDIEKQKH